MLYFYFIFFCISYILVAGVISGAVMCLQVGFEVKIHCMVDYPFFYLFKWFLYTDRAINDALFCFWMDSY